MITVKEDRTMDCIREQAEKWKAQIREAARKGARDYIIMMWMGYLNGLRMAGVVSRTEYDVLYLEMKNYAEGFEAGQKRKTGQPAEGTAGSPEHRKYLIPGL